MEQTDEMLVEKYLNGDLSAFEQIYLRYIKMINSFTRSYFICGGDEDDLRQEGTLGLLRAIKTFDRLKGTFGTYAYTCIKSNVINAVVSAEADKHKPLNNSVPILERELSPSVSFPPPPEESLINHESLDELIKAIGNLLSSKEQKVFNLYIKGWNYREIAKKLDQDPKSIDNALWRIKAKIKKYRGL